MVKLFIYIGKVLENFAQQVGIWKYCMHFIEKTNNEYVIMYCLNVLEVSTVFVKFTPRTRYCITSASHKSCMAFDESTRKG